MPVKKILLPVVILSAFASFYLFDLDRFLSLEAMQQARVSLQHLLEQKPLLLAGLYFGLYVLVTAVSLPGAALLTLLGGALFGLGWGLLLVSFASSIGATLAFLVSRYLLRDWVQQRFGQRLAGINRGVEREGGFYLFALRLVPVVPFFLINLLMGLTPIRVARFYLVSQIGMLPGTLVYVNAGTQLAQLESLSGLASPELLLSFVLLGIFPLLARRLLDWLKARRVYRGWQKPQHFDYNLVVIGAGSGGLVAALIAATVKARVALIERDKMGGDCLNTGCVPSKALLASARLARKIGESERYGLKTGPVTVDFPKVMQHVQQAIRTIEPHDSVERFTSLGVECLSGEARLASPWQVDVGDRSITARNIIIATGARPLLPPLPGLADCDPLTSDNLWSLQQLPERLLVLGGGPIGCELAQAFCRLGSQVTMVEMAPRLLLKEDPEFSHAIEQELKHEGVRVLTGHRAEQFEQKGSAGNLRCTVNGMPEAIEFDRVLVAVGRRANTEGLGLEPLGIERRDNGTLAVDEYLRTRFPNIFACGDVCGPYQFTHAASHQAWYASVNALFGGVKKFRADYRYLPWATFTDPAVARVGLNEQEAEEQGIAYEVTRYDLSDLDRAIADGNAQGEVKVLTEPGRDRILGATICAHGAEEMITEFVTAMKQGHGLNAVLGTIHLYPSLSEANKFAAGNWKKAHAPERLLSLLPHYHRWLRHRGLFSNRA